MAKKSIADLRRYRAYLVDLEHMKEKRCEENVYVRTEIDSFDMAEELSMISDLSRIADLIAYEIALAEMSNSISYNGENISLYQADKLLWQLSIEDGHLQKLLLALRKCGENSEILRYKTQTISEDVLVTRREEIKGELYKLKDSTKRAEAKTFIEIDMDEFTPSFLGRKV